MPVVQRPAIARSRLDFPVPDSPTISIRSFAPSSNDNFSTSIRPPGKTKKADGSIQRLPSLSWNSFDKHRRRFYLDVFALDITVNSSTIYVSFKP